MTVLAVDLATYPTWADRPISRHPAGPAWGGSQAVVVLAVDGMTCSAWEGEIAHELVSAPGVRTATVSFKAGRATVATERNVPTEELTAAVTRAGYRARVLAR